MEEISTSFCFICLLHLANEQGLKISTNTESTLVGDTGNVTTSDLDRSIGNIWNLKVYGFAIIDYYMLLIIPQVSRDPEVAVGAA
jgi:hypothetical protein